MLLSEVQRNNRLLNILGSNVIIMRTFLIHRSEIIISCSIRIIPNILAGTTANRRDELFCVRGHTSHVWREDGGKTRQLPLPLLERHVGGADILLILHSQVPAIVRSQVAIPVRGGSAELARLTLGLGEEETCSSCRRHSVWLGAHVSKLLVAWPGYCPSRRSLRAVIAAPRP